MRIWRDVAIHADASGNELTVVSDVPGVVDQELTLGLLGPDGQLDLRVRVLDSNPQILDGVVRHRVKLLLLDVALS
jgi:hypothetical protein